MSNQNNTSRKVRNFLLNPSIQLAFALNIIVLSVFFVIGVAFVIYFQLGDLIQNILNIADFDTKTLVALQGDWDKTLIWLGLFMSSFIILLTILCVLYTHRLIGPTVAFKRHIDALKAGNYGSRVNLRDGDAFEDVAQKLNELAKTLEDTKPED